MAVTIQNSFNDVVALQKPLVLTASSTNTSEEKFRYVMTIDVNGTEVIKVKQQANSNDYVHFDLYQILKDYLSPRYEKAAVSVHKILNAISGSTTGAYIDINVYEEYSTSTTTDPTEYPATENATTQFIIINTTYQFKDGTTPSLAAVYEYDGDDTELSWLTNMPTTLKTRAGEYQSAAILISDFADPISDTVVFEYIFYDSAGGVNRTVNVARASMGCASFVGELNESGGDNIYQFFPVGFQNLLEQSITSNLKPTASDSYYTVKVYDNAGTELYRTKTYRFNIVSDCKYTPIQLAWVNALGAWDYYTFELAHTEKLNIQRETFRKPYGNWGAGAIYTYSQYESGDTIYKIEADKQYTVNSDWLNDSDFEWLQELLMSKEVQFVNENGDFTPVIITDTDYEFKQDVNNKLNNLQLTFKLAHKIK